MEYLILILTILAIHIFAWLTPGPLFVLIVRNSLVYSRKSGIWTAVGIAIGNFLHISYAVIAILLVATTSDTAFFVMKYLGVAYLVYLGIKTMLIKVETDKTDEEKERKDMTKFSAAKTGFFTNILSPKASLFFASIFAAIISSGAPLWVVVFLWIAMPLNSLMMAVILSVFFTQKRIRSAYSKYQYIVNKFLGAALLLLAILIAFKG